MTDVTSDYLALRRGVAAVAVARDVVAVRGADAVAFLQGQLSADVAALGVGGHAWSLLLEPQGRLDAWLRVWRTGEQELLLDVDGGWGERTIARLDRFRLRVDARLEPLAWRCVALRGPAAPGVDTGACGAELVAGVDWRGLPGVDLLGPEVAVPDGVHVADPLALRSVRIEQGWPVMGHELDETVIPAEVGQWFVDLSVSFTKGCYVGQELVARMDSRGGTAPRQLRGVTVRTNVLPPEGAAVIHDGRDRGRLASVGESLDLRAPVALALVHRSVPVGAEVELCWDGGSAPAQVVELPMC